MNPRKVVAVSGGFDPMHIGHIQMLEQARALGDELIVIVNNDEWLKTKKGFAFMPEGERVALLEKYPFVDRVVLTDHVADDPDRSVSRTLEMVRPDIFANGGDRGATNTPEADVAERLGIEMAYGIGGGKVQSSSWMTAHAALEAASERKPWGLLRTHMQTGSWHLKSLRMSGGAETAEVSPATDTTFILMEGDATIATEASQRALIVGEAFRVPEGVPYRLSSENGCEIVEIDSYTEK